MKIDVSTIKPQNESVLVSVLFADEVDGDGVYVGPTSNTTKMSAEFYHGRVISLSEGATTEKQCPGLLKGDHVIFNTAAGAAVNTESNYCKVINGYDIVAIVKDLNMNKESIKPTADRILVELIGEAKTDENGFVIGEGVNPMEAQTQKGKVISIGPSVNKMGYKEGDIVFFHPYCGNLVVDNNKMQLKTVNSFDILFTI